MELHVCIEAHEVLKPLAATCNAICGFAHKKGILENPLEATPWIDVAMPKTSRGCAIADLVRLFE